MGALFTGLIIVLIFVLSYFAIDRLGRFLDRAYQITHGQPDEKKKAREVLTNRKKPAVITDVIKCFRRRSVHDKKNKSRHADTKDRSQHDGK